ncbi:putative bifunctional diguanylate cyclase/phosphodiesterase [Salibacterium halotolerans]|uniref:EAL domain, c-di-GMP-specific phosphodiesterase class I (Or its enzymatically inactive variant) n=1 Tax=Salibacterium halotolerans TaxID=1884432 RepID=A0A1I5T3X5_9BACI|nr:bifunctional diguanylate cyclase/phosphodiesterase [Salibacterium halotolerans]SFP77705.1 EAL domain, c-di-GMP-specific phosphodiesterase class I (or its enzymatically inactive variant) [Salibacterium halotolerans]
MKEKVLVVTGCYFAVGLLWVILTDRLIPEGRQEPVLQTLKGCLFVGGTAVLLYFALQQGLGTSQMQRRNKEKADLLYETVFDNVTDFVFIARIPEKDDQLRFFEWNKKALEWLGEKGIKSDLTFQELSSEEWQEEALRQQHRILEHKQLTFDWEIADYSGRVLPVKVQTTMTGFGDNRTIIAAFKDVSAYREAVHNIYELSYYDKITQLPNENFFIKHLQEMDSKQNRMVMALSFHHFRRISETMGMDTENTAAALAAAKLQSVIGPGEALARKSNHEFLLLFFRRENDAEQAVNALLRAFEQPIEVSGREIFVSFTAGIALDTDGRKQPEFLLQQADIAFSHAERSNQRYGFYRPGIEQEARIQYELENDLHFSIERGELFVMYQPFVYGSEGATKGMEALLRWKHPVHGMIPPSTFIPMAEENGLIHQLGRWVLEEVCREAGPVLKRNRSWTAAVNLSSRQLEHSGFIEELPGIVHAYGVEPDQLELEITERTMMQPERMLPVLNRLKAYGFRLSLDDFGTGYSSLSQLKELPVDTLKIDRSFIEDMNETQKNAAIVQTIIHAARNLNMKVVAEGIEEAEQAQELLEMACFYFQGYYFSVPKTIQEFPWSREA